MSIDQVLGEIGKLPEDLHSAGSLSIDVLRCFVELVGDTSIESSMETGSGRSTILLSHLSQNHTVFALEVYDGHNTNSVRGIRDLPFFNRAHVTFIEGASQQTLPPHVFEHPLQLALLDGPHAYPFPDLEYYYVYPHLAEGALLVVDDIHIPTIHHLFDFLKEDEMFTLSRVVEKTAFFRRTNVPTFNPYQDGWWLQKYNKTRYPISPELQPLAPKKPRRRSLRSVLKKRVKKMLPAG